MQGFSDDVRKYVRLQLEAPYHSVTMKTDHFSENIPMAFRFMISASILICFFCSASADPKEGNCSLSPKAVTSDYAEAVLVIKGRLIRTEVIKTYEGYANVRCHVEVVDVFKGRADPRGTILFNSTVESSFAPFNSGSYEPQTERIFFLTEKPTIRDFEFFTVENSGLIPREKAIELLRALKDAWDAYMKVADQFVEEEEEEED